MCSDKSIAQGGSFAYSKHQGCIECQGTYKEVETHKNQPFDFLVQRKGQFHADICLFYQQDKGQNCHNGLCNQACPCSSFQIQSGNKPFDTVDKDKVQNNVEPSPQHGDDHRVEGVLQSAENTKDGKGEQGKWESPNSNGIVGYTILQYFSRRIKERKNLFDHKNGGEQHYDAQTDVEKNGLCGHIFYLVQSSCTQILGNDGRNGATGLAQNPNQHGQKGAYDACRGKRFQPVYGNIAHYGRIRNGEDGFRNPRNGCRDCQLVDALEVYLRAQIGRKLQH